MSDPSPGRIRPGDLRRGSIRQSQGSASPGVSPRNRIVSPPTEAVVEAGMNSSQRENRASFRGSPERSTSNVRPTSAVSKGSHNYGKLPSPKSRKGSQAFPTCGQEKINITREDIEQVFKFFDTDDKGVLRMKDLKAKLDIFFPHFTSKEYKLLISESNFTVDTLWSLVNENIWNVTVDPAFEAFKVYDPKNTGFVDVDTLKTIMQQLGYGNMTAEEAASLVKTADWDNDGKVGIEDFRRLLGFFPAFRKEAPEEAPRFEVQIIKENSEEGDDCPAL